MSTATATYRRRNRIYEPVQDPTSQQGFNRYAYCFYNPLKYVDPSGYRCDNPPYQLQVQQYLMCMNAENAEALNNVGITHVQVNSSQGYSGSYVQYQVAGEWYGFHYNGYVDVGYDDGYGGQTTYSDGSLPTPPTPMYWNEGGGCGGGAASSGGGSSHPVVPVGNGDGKTTLKLYQIPVLPKSTDSWFNSGNYYITFNGGDHVKIVITNGSKFTSVNFTIEDQSIYHYEGFFNRRVFDGDIYNTTLLPGQSKSLDFYHFGFPFQWMFNVNVNCDVSILYFDVSSTWRDGMPDPNVFPNPIKLP